MNIGLFWTRCSTEQLSNGHSYEIIINDHKSRQSDEHPHKSVLFRVYLPVVDQLKHHFLYREEDYDQHWPTISILGRDSNKSTK